jgi:hypothetical protein
MFDTFSKIPSVLPCLAPQNIPQRQDRHDITHTCYSVQVYDVFDDLVVHDALDALGALDAHVLACYNRDKPVVGCTLYKCTQ